MNRLPLSTRRAPGSGRTRTRCLTLSLVALVAGSGHAQSSAKLARVQLGHAHQLAQLSDLCVEKKLFNDAERLLRTALRLAPRDQSLEHRQKQLRERWIGVNKDREQRDAHKRFWESRGYDAARAKLSQREAKLRGRIIEQYLGLAKGAADKNSELADGAFRAVFEVDPDSPALAARAGTQRMQRYRSERPGLSALKLGETVVGKPTDLQQLHGKVVLWRSFSL